MDWFLFDRYLGHERVDYNGEEGGFKSLQLLELGHANKVAKHKCLFSKTDIEPVFNKDDRVYHYILLRCFLFTPGIYFEMQHVVL